MANRIWKETKSPKQVRVVYGKFYPDTANAPTGLVGSGVKSVSRTAQGVFSVVFEDKWQKSQVISMVPGVQHTTAVDLVAQFGDFTSGTAAVDASVVIRLNAVATPTDMAANADNSVSFAIAFQNNPRS